MQPTQNPATLADNPARTLRAAGRYLIRHGWIQGAYYDATTGSFTPAACLVGAIAVVCYGGPVDAPAQMFGHPGFAEFEAALTFLDMLLMERFGVVSYEFNDAKGRIFAEILGALHGAADVWTRDHGGAA
jgi:hypothetical protein